VGARRNSLQQSAVAKMYAIKVSDGQGGGGRPEAASKNRPTNDLHNRPL
jgi:hypothetical protein